MVSDMRSMLLGVARVLGLILKLLEKLFLGEFDEEPINRPSCSFLFPLEYYELRLLFSFLTVCGQ